MRETIIKTQQTLYINANKHPDAIADHQRRWDMQPYEEMLSEMDAARWYLNDFRVAYPRPEALARITAPTLVITGETDPVASPDDARAIHRAIPGAELYLHGGGHMPLGEEREPFFERIGDFFARNGVPVRLSAPAP